MAPAPTLKCPPAVEIVPMLMEQHTRVSAHFQKPFDICQKAFQAYLTCAFIKSVKAATTEENFFFFHKLGDNNTPM